MKIKTILCTFLCVFLYNSHAQDIKIAAIPYTMHLENTPCQYEVLSANQLRLTAPSGTDLFISPDGGFRVNKSPRLLFKPDSDFILSAKIKLEFNSNWDAGVLLIYNDDTHYAKCCFESDYRGTPRVVTVVCNEVADDCNSIAIEGGEVYFRIAGSHETKTFNFYCSENQASWYLIRSFRLENTDNLHIGFSAQSPAGESCTVDFSDIDLQQRKLKNFWQGD